MKEIKPFSEKELKEFDKRIPLESVVSISLFKRALKTIKELRSSRDINLVFDEHPVKIFSYKSPKGVYIVTNFLNNYQVVFYGTNDTVCTYIDDVKNMNEVHSIIEDNEEYEI